MPIPPPHGELDPDAWPGCPGSANCRPSHVLLLRVGVWVSYQEQLKVQYSWDQPVTAEQVRNKYETHSIVVLSCYLTVVLLRCKGDHDLSWDRIITDLLRGTSYSLLLF